MMTVIIFYTGNSMENSTCMSGLTLVILKEIRLERGIQSAYIAEQVGKSPSAWAKIETGKSTFPMDSLFQVARALWTPPSAIIGAVERYSNILSQNGWAVLNSSLNADDDQMLIQAQQYYGSFGFKRRFLPTYGHIFTGLGVSVLNSPIFYADGSSQLVDVFRFVIDESFRATQLI
jgi:transcriptional regulator with XRE-family HTH domain